MDATVTPRQTKYCQSIEALMLELGHATNSEILHELRSTYPLISATTVHRATARLAERGALSIAPAAPDGAMRYDGNTTAHDHFMCSSCGRLRDVDIKSSVDAELERHLDGCKISGRITITGVCASCHGGVIS